MTKNKVIKAWLVENKFDNLPYIFKTKKGAKSFIGITKDKIYRCEIKIIICQNQ